MTTTNTSNLNLAKPDVGSEANNWGNILNTSLDDIDKAIAQRLVKSVGGSSDIVLTASDSKFAVIELTGTLSGNINVKTFANDAKPYIVFNNTSGSFSLTFKTNTGNGVTLVQGQKTIIYSDGTNMVSAVDTGQLSTSRTITLSGDVTGSVATDFSTNPTITTAIGTGVVVNADVNASAAIDASKIADGSISNTEFQRLNGVSSDIQTQINSKIDGSSLNANNLNSGTVPNARYGTPTFNGSNLTSLNASNLSSGTVPSARLPASALTSTVKKVSVVQSTANYESTTTIPWDTSIPTVSEGIQVMSHSFTPTASNSRILHVLQTAVTNASAGQPIIWSIFNGSTNIGQFANTTGSSATWNLVTGQAYESSSGSTSARTYTCRFGPNTSRGHWLQDNYSIHKLSSKATWTIYELEN